MNLITKIQCILLLLGFIMITVFVDITIVAISGLGLLSMAVILPLTGFERKQITGEDE